MIIKPVLKRLRDAWPETRIILRGEWHFSKPELIPLALDDPDTDFIFGLTGNSVPAKPAALDIDAVRQIYQLRGHQAKPAGQTIPKRSHTYHQVEFPG
jgi:hypothetical protein